MQTICKSCDIYTYIDVHRRKYAQIWNTFEKNMKCTKSVFSYVFMYVYFFHIFEAKLGSRARSRPRAQGRRHVWAQKCATKYENNKIIWFEVFHMIFILISCHFHILSRMFILFPYVPLNPIRITFRFLIISFYDYVYIYICTLFSFVYVVCFLGAGLRVLAVS